MNIESYDSFIISVNGKTYLVVPQEQEREIIFQIFDEDGDSFGVIHQLGNNEYPPSDDRLFWMQVENAIEKHYL